MLLSSSFILFASGIWTCPIHLNTLKCSIEDCSLLHASSRVVSLIASVSDRFKTYIAYLTLLGQKKFSNPFSDKIHHNSIFALDNSIFLWSVSRSQLPFIPLCLQNSLNSIELNYQPLSVCKHLAGKLVSFSIRALKHLKK